MTCKTVATIGFFDGVHLGHRYLIGEVAKAARAEGRQSVAVTFDRHPREVLQSDYQPQLLTTTAQKARLLREAGADRVEVLHFTRELAAMSAREFMLTVLKERLGVAKLFIGYDHRFGHNRTEGFADYVAYGREMGIEVVQNPELPSCLTAKKGVSALVAEKEPSGLAAVNGGEPSGLAAVGHVSSTAVRRLLSAGDVEGAARLLGRRHTLLGHVAHGFAEGRKMGFPTANLDTTGYRLLVPAPGVYVAAVKTLADDAQLDATVGGDCPCDGWHRAMLNIGTRPTFGGTTTTIEAHLLDFHGDLYGRPMAVALFSRVRDERRFDSVEALEAQLHNDREAVRNFFCNS